MRSVAFAGLVAWGLLVGCSGEPPQPDRLTGDELARIPVLEPGKIGALLESHKGKVVVLVVWSVRREACVAMYPQLGTLSGGGAEPVVIAVNIDRVDDVRNKVLPLLDEHQPKFLNRICRAGPDALAAFVDPRWMGQVPALAVYDRAGRRVAAFMGEDALAQLKGRLPKLLKR